MKKLLMPAALLCALAPLPAAFGQGMLGSTLHYSFMFPDTSTEFDTPAGPADYLITGAVEIPIDFFNRYSIDVTHTQIIMTMLTGGSWTTAAFNGVMWSDISNSLGAITSVTVDPSTNYFGFAPSRVTFTADSIAINMQDLEGSIGSHIVLNVTVAPSPAAAALLGIGGLTTTRRRR